MYYFSKNKNISNKIVEDNINLNWFYSNLSL